MFMRCSEIAVASSKTATDWKNGRCDWIRQSDSPSQYDADMRLRSARVRGAWSVAAAVFTMSSFAALAQELPRDATTLPRVVREVQPDYTEEAKAARIEGTVWTAVTVRADGTVADDVEITRSLDAAFGLDSEAVKAAKQWLFAPATKNGEPVPVRITLEFKFKLAP